MPEEGNILCDLIVHSKLIKSQQDVFPFILDVNLKIYDNYNLMYIFHVMIFCIYEIGSCRHNRRDNNIPNLILAFLQIIGWYTFQNYHMVIYRPEKCPMKGQILKNTLHTYILPRYADYLKILYIYNCFIYCIFLARFVKFLFIVIYIPCHH